MMFLGLLSKRTGHTVRIDGKEIEREARFLLPPLFQSCCSAGGCAGSFPGSTARLSPSMGATGSCALAHGV